MDEKYLFLIIGIALIALGLRSIIRARSILEWKLRHPWLSGINFDPFFTAPIYKSKYAVTLIKVSGYLVVVIGAVLVYDFFQR